MSDKVTLKQIEEFFPKAMQNGYASGAESTPANKPGWEEIIYEEGDFLCVDEWCTNKEASKSVGTTSIEYKGKLVWFMSYGGFYDKRALHFLKQVLRHQYQRNDSFYGGRGPKYLMDPNYRLIYLNKPEINEFGNFRGREEIFSLDYGYLGHHNYCGMSLI